MSATTTPLRLALGAALPLLALLGTQGAALGADEPRVTSAVQATKEDLAPTRTYGAPYLAVNPEDPNMVVAASPEMRSRVCRFLISRDAGRSWKLMDALPNPPSYPFCFQTSGTTFQTPIAFGRDGRLYYAHNGYDVSDGGMAQGNISVLLARSDDLGQTWQSATARNARGKEGNDRESLRPVTGIAVDTESASEDIVYVGYNYRTNSTPARVSQSAVAASTDGGRTFGEQVFTLADYYKDRPNKDKWGGGNTYLGVADDGTLYAASYGSTSESNVQANSILVSKSSDRGKTFTTVEVDKPDGFYGPITMTWSDDGGKAGTIHLVYEDKESKPDLGDRDIFYRNSTDGGVTWSAATQLNDDNPNALVEGVHAQTNPNISVAPNGRIDAAWWDFRNDQGQFHNDVYYAYSNDNGATWSKNVRVTDLSINRRVGVWTNGYDMRMPPGVVATDKLAVFAWDDTRNTDQLSEGQDIYAATVQHEAIGAGDTNAMRYAAAALGGLAAVGLVLLLLSAAGRRKGDAGGGGPTSARKVAADEPRRTAGRP